MYPPELVIPRKKDLSEHGFEELTTAHEVDELLKEKGTTFVVINSICGCAAANARPAAKFAVENSDKTPLHLATAFAGVDTEAVARLREYMLPYPPSSPSMALFKDGNLVEVVERHQIEGRPAELIAQHLMRAFGTHC
ncbi:MAG: BrxA/BrxB family bacilliredoxin [Chitinophagales bacterium]|nr:BrxA/BrxB family bacilliredoxin [Bacteroidota bacterium]